MAVNLSPVGGVAAQFFDNAGNVLTGGKLQTYLAGTTTPQPAYTTSAGNVPWSNPIILDAAGRVSGSGEIWLTDGIQYKFILRDSNDVLIATYDNINGINSNFVAFTNQQEIQTATAGQTVFNLATTTYQPGTNSLSVFVDGVNQYGPGAQYAYIETDSDTVTFVNGLHVGALVKFTTSQLNSGAGQNAAQTSFTGFKGQVGNVQDLADDDGSDWIGFEPAGTSAVARSAQDKMRETVSVMDFGAVGDGVTDDSAAFIAAITASDTVVIPAGNYLIESVITIPADNKTLIGTGGVIVRGAALTNGPTITATSKNNLKYENLVFNVEVGTPHVQDGNFVTHFSCNYITCIGNTFDASIPGAATQKESLLTAFTTFDCNFVTIQGNQFRYLFGNCCGPNSTDNGVNGHDFSIVGNVFYNCVDTSVGCWTDANAVTITGNTFSRDDYTTSYNGVFMDVAGAFNVTISGNTFNGNVVGVRCLTNLDYTNKNIVVNGNVFENQTDGPSETAQCIKISHSDNSSGGQQSMDISILNNIFNVTADGWGVDIVSTITVTTTEELKFVLNNNKFDLSAGNNSGVIFQKLSTNGALNIVPGNNMFTLGSGSVAIGGNLPDKRYISSNGNVIANKSSLTLTANGTVDAMRLDTGFYGIMANSATVSLGTGTGSQFVFETSTSALPNTLVIDGSNQTVLSAWNTVNQPDNYKLNWSANGSGYSYAINYVSVIRLI
jgi:hypothetical protein